MKISKAPKPSKGSLKVYEYPKCSTCVKALKFLDASGVDYEKIDITLQPPSLAEFKTMLSHGVELRKLFNTSGLVYKEMKLSEKLPELSEAEALKLLSGNGRLVKRPFLLGPDFGLVGFREEEWSAKIS
ncbi:MAG: arsenate reductase family protein [Proteobacteria bacterium]|nr:MAG: arsenate reductase family protein [Pseudomonadota bacterium]